MKPNYEEFDNSMKELINIEQKLNALNSSSVISLSEVIELRESALSHHKICNDILKEIKEPTKQNNES